MAKVDEPRFGWNGEVSCRECPLDWDEDDSPCKDWWYRNGDTWDLVCPTADTYAEAVRMAEEATHDAP